MNLLSMLLSSMLSSGSVNNLSGKTGLSSQQVAKLVRLALPILLKAMTGNASSASGLASLVGALTQHTSKSSFADQIGEADTRDGSRIIGHILGSEEDAVVSRLAGESGASADQVSALLSMIAPALMSGVSAASHAQVQSQTQTLSQAAPAGGVFDLSSMLSMFGGMSQPLVEEPKQDSAAMDGSALLGALLTSMLKG